MNKKRNSAAVKVVLVTAVVAFASFARLIPAQAQTVCSESAPLLVSLAPGTPANQTVHGTLCTPSYWPSSSHQIDILTSGATYNRSYWDFPTNQPSYSYVKKTANAGRAAFAYDRIGVGTSSHPPSADISVVTDAYVLRQIVQRMRSIGYSKVNLIGHSYGSSVSIREAATYHDVNRVVVTGLLHSAGPKAATLATSLHPANLEPRFANQSLDSGYVTTLPGTRGDLFYNVNGADPSVITKDEATKDIYSTATIPQLLVDVQTPAALNITNQVTVPVLLVTGVQDGLVCGLPVDCSSEPAVQANEAPYFTHSPSMTARTIQNTGHDLTLHYSAATSFAIINQWL